MDLLQRVTESLKAFELWTVCTRVLKTSDCFEDPFCLKCFVCFNWCIPLHNFYSFLSSSVQFRSNSQKSVVLVVKPASLKHCFFKKKLFFQQHRYFLLLPKPPHLFPVIYSFDYYFKYTSNNIDVSSVQSA